MIQSEEKTKELKWTDSQRLVGYHQVCQHRHNESHMMPHFHSAVYLKRIVQGSTVHKWSYSAIKRIEVLIYTMAMDELWKHVQTKTWTWIFMVTLLIMAKGNNSNVQHIIE